MIPSFQTPKKFVVIMLKFLTMWLYHRVMSPNDADGMANSVNPLGAVWSGSALFGQAYLSENLGSLRYNISSHSQDLFFWPGCWWWKNSCGPELFPAPWRLDLFHCHQMLSKDKIMLRVQTFSWFTVQKCNCVLFQTVNWMLMKKSFFSLFNIWWNSIYGILS